MKVATISWPPLLAAWLLSLSPVCRMSSACVHVVADCWLPALCRHSFVGPIDVRKRYNYFGKKYLWVNGLVDSQTVGRWNVGLVGWSGEAPTEQCTITWRQRAITKWNASYGSIMAHAGCPIFSSILLRRASKCMYIDWFDYKTSISVFPCIGMYRLSTFICQRALQFSGQLVSQECTSAGTFIREMVLSFFLHQQYIIKSLDSSIRCTVFEHSI